MRGLMYAGLIGAGFTNQMKGGICYAPPDGGDSPAPGDVKKLEGILADMGKALTKTSDDVKRSAEAVQTEIKNLGTVTSATKETADKALTESAAARERIGKMEEIVARLRDAGLNGEAPKSPGAQFVGSDAYKAALPKLNMSGQRLRIDVKNMISSATTDADGSAGDLVIRDRQMGIVTPAIRRLTVRDLLMPGRTDSNAIEYVRETGFTNNAGPQTGGVEGGLKLESTLKFADLTVGVKTIAHFVKASKQILDDAKMLQSYIDTRMRYGLKSEEERQLLNGDGNGGTMEGLIPQATAFSANFAPSDWNLIDTIRLAYLQAALAEWPATGVVLNPIDWARIELTKDAEGRYIFAQPQSVAGPTLWGQPVVATQAMTADTFLAGAFTPAAQIFDREQDNVQISTENEDDFIRNKVTIRAEERLALVVYRPEALIYGTFDHS